MPVYRFYHDDTLSENQSCTLSETEGKHFASTLRGKEGDTVELFNGKGSLAHAKAVEVTKKSVSVIVERVEHVSPSSQNVLIQALVRGSKLDLIIEKATELGIDTFHLFVADRSEKAVVKESQLKRLETITIAACKQSGRLFVPTIVLHDSLSSTPYAESAYGSFDKDAKPLAIQSFVNGPESGFSEKELKLLSCSKKATLSTNILRTETAAIAAATVIGLL